MICRSKGNGKFAVIDAMVNLDKKFEEKVYLDYFHYKLNDHAMWYGEESAIAEFTKRMKDKIDEYNVKRAKNGMNLLNIYGEQIKNKMEDSNEIKELDLIDSTENCLEESSSL
mgnify:CR=1 FL=1